MHLSHWSQTLSPVLPSHSSLIQRKPISSSSSSWLFSWHLSSDLFVLLQRFCKEKYYFKLGMIPFEEFVVYFTFFRLIWHSLDFNGWLLNFLWAYNFSREGKLKLHSLVVFIKLRRCSVWIRFINWEINVFAFLSLREKHNLGKWRRP